MIFYLSVFTSPMVAEWVIHRSASTSAGMLVYALVSAALTILIVLAALSHGTKQVEDGRW